MTLSEQILAFLNESSTAPMTAEEIWEALPISRDKRILPYHVRQALARGLFVKGIVIANGDVRVDGDCVKAGEGTLWCIYTEAPPGPGYVAFDPMMKDLWPVGKGRWSE